MRLWHKDLIPVLPRQQLLGQWRECCLIAKNIAEKGMPGHILVNRIMNDRPEYFIRYTREVFYEMKRRGYSCQYKTFSQYTAYPNAGWNMQMSDVFPNWHNKRYLYQCYYNLQEKYDCGGITDEEFSAIHKRFIEIYYK